MRNVPGGVKREARTFASELDELQPAVTATTAVTEAIGKRHSAREVSSKLLREEGAACHSCKIEKIEEDSEAIGEQEPFFFHFFFIILYSAVLGLSTHSLSDTEVPGPLLSPLSARM